MAGVPGSSARVFPAPLSAVSAGGGCGFAPWLLIVAAVGACGLLLSLPLNLPAGAFYWDLYVYVDGAHRVLRGQMPSVDFFAPVGPISYWLFAASMKVFPGAQPLLGVNWCMLVVSAPAMAAVLIHVDRRSRPLAFGLCIPFLIFQLLPVNVEQFTFYLGFDSFGAYNRHTSGLLYVLVAMLLFVREQRLLAFGLAWLLIGLFLLKITGFVLGVGLCLYALAAGRVSWRAALGSAAIFLGAMTALDLATGVVSAYLTDILTLLRMNSDTLLSRIVRAGSLHAEAVVATLLLLLALGWQKRAAPWRAGTAGSGRLLGRSGLFDGDLAWVAAVAGAALLFETQNTGGHAFLFLWPVLLRVLAGSMARGREVLIPVLVAAIAAPPALALLGRTARNIATHAQYQRLDLPILKGLGRVTQRPDTLQNATVRQRVDAATLDAQTLYFESGGKDDVETFASPKFQILWLRAAAEAAEAVRRVERETGTVFRSVLNLGFVNPFPYILDRDAPRLVAIGADPNRTTPRPDAATLASIAETDLLLASHCPLTAMDRDVQRLYSPAIAGRVAMKLSPCWTAYPRSAPRLPFPGAP